MSKATRGDTVSGAEGKRVIESGQAPDGLTVLGRLAWPEPRRLPRLPRGLTCFSLDLSRQPITGLPEGLTVTFRLSLGGCTKLQSLPQGLSAGSLDVSGCTSLAALPEGLAVSFLDISDCRQLRDWPESGRIEVGRIRMRNCTGLRSLPPWLTRLAQLDVSGCTGLVELPGWLSVSSWIDLAGTSLTSLPNSLRETPLRWRGVPVDERIVFRPQEITAAEILAETNVELRRVKLERMGFEKFLREARAEILDEDRDAGGPRRLLRVPLDGDEPLVCVSVNCPSTGRQYVIRVPPETPTCRHAVAWTAGFDDPDDYHPLVET